MEEESVRTTYECAQLRFTGSRAEAAYHLHHPEGEDLGDRQQDNNCQMDMLEHMPCILAIPNSR